MSDPIPQNISAVIKAWAEQKKTGQVALNLNEGKIVNAELKERVKAES